MTAIAHSPAAQAPFVHFIYVEGPDVERHLGPAALGDIRAALRDIPNLHRALLMLPAEVRDMYTDDGASPRLVIQLYYPRIEDLEHAAGASGPLQRLRNPALWRDLGDVTITHQAMIGRAYPVPDATLRQSGDAPPCAYMVHYPGHADDFNAWLTHYLDNHPQIMFDFPAIRDIELYTRCDWRDALDWQRVHYMQRNRQIFDNVAGLQAALSSPVRVRMRADFEAFPTFHGSNRHFPMYVETVV